jgi:ERCC4-type nuclease
MSDKNNINITEKKSIKDINQNKEKANIEQQKDIMKEKANEIKSIYETMIKLRKQNLSGNKKFESSN